MTRVVETAQSFCRVGVATREITPPVGIYHRMWGAAVHDQAEGVHRPLVATALWMAPRTIDDAPSAGSNESLREHRLFIALDHCLLHDRDAEAITASIEQHVGIAAEHVVLCCSHTHAAGLMLRDRVKLPGGNFIEPYLEQLTHRLVSAAAEARERLSESVIAYGQTQCDLARFRDYWDDAAGKFICGYAPDGGGDTTVVVGRITRPTGELMATLVNYACHPTTLAWENRLISPDYPGAMRELIEQSTGAPCIFLQGASGDLGPREGFSGDVDLADRNGRQLGFAALASLEALPPPGTRFVYQGFVVSGANLGVWRHEPIDDEQRRSALSHWAAEECRVPLPYRAELPREDEVRASLDKWRSEEQQAIESGDEQHARDCHAMVERHVRQLARLEALPAGDHFPVRAAVLRAGDAVWVAVQGEPYSVLQTELRRRFPDRVLVVTAVAFGWGPSYLPPRSAYGKEIYQETIAVLAPGSLEQLIDALTAAIERLS